MVVRIMSVILATLWCVAGASHAAQVIYVPSQMADLQMAINQISHGGTIEIAAGTFLTAPSSGYSIQNQPKAFTIRAASPGTVTLDGAETHIIVRFQNSTIAQGGPVVFDGLVFSNGRNAVSSTGSAVSVIRAEATFVDCTFQDNVSVVPAAGTASGAVQVNTGIAYFDRCVWQRNTSTSGGAAITNQGSSVWVHGSQFYDNLANPPNHRQIAAGGAIWLGNGVLRVSNSRFEGNQAGYVGGAIFGIGDFVDPVSIPNAEMTVANCTFVDNAAVPDPTVTLAVPTEAGAFHAENQATAMVFASRFVGNQSENGGGVNLYRAIVEVYESVFDGNRAVGSDASTGTGGALAAISNDTNNATTNWGAINRRSASLLVNGSFVRGLGAAHVAQGGGGLFAAGDNNRVYGGAGVNPMGTVAENRAHVDLENVLFTELAVEKTAPASAQGGALLVNLADLDVTGSLFSDSDAAGQGAHSQGGGLAIISNSFAHLSGSMVAGNSAATYGAGLSAFGATLDIMNTSFLHNELSPGTSEPQTQSYGAAIMTQPDQGNTIDVDGIVQGCLISDNVGLAILDFDYDAAGGPVNRVQYNQNSFYATTFGDLVYRDSLPGTGYHNAAGLNGLVINRPVTGTTTDKSPGNNNSGLGSRPSYGEVFAAPAVVIPATAAGDTETSTSAFLAYAWTGSSATLDGSPLATRIGVVEDASVGQHTLVVDGTPYTVTVSGVASPTATFTANPAVIEPGGTSTLSWSTAASTFLEMAIDHGVPVAPAASGAVQLSPAVTTTYTLFVITTRGGVVETATVYVGEGELIFEDDFELGDTSAWSVTVP